MSSLLFFFFKQKTAYEMRISDWSSDVCSSDLPARSDRHRHAHRPARPRPLAGAAARRCAGRPPSQGRTEPVVPQPPRLRAADALPYLRPSPPVPELPRLDGRTPPRPPPPLPPSTPSHAAPPHLHIGRAAGKEN